MKNNPDPKKSSITFFGLEKNSDILFNILNDKIKRKAKETVILSNFITKNKANESIPLFYIDYNKFNNNFYIKSINKEIYFSLLMNKEKKYYLERGNFYYIKIGKIVIIIAINSSKNEIKIKIKEHFGMTNEHIFIYNRNNMPITIGRVNCTIIINNSSVSKLHATISYDEKKEEYYIIDNNSTNGTQLILNDEKSIDLNDKMMFYIGEKNFTIELVNIE